MTKICTKCGKKVEHVHLCSHCKQEFCIPHSRHYKGHYFCVDCINKYYRAPTRVRKPRAAPLPQKQAGFGFGFAKPPVQQGQAPAPPQIDARKMLVPIIVLIAVIVAAGVGTIKAGGLSRGGAIENESATVVEEIGRLDTNMTNVFPHMAFYLEVTNYSLSCAGNKVTEMEFELRAGGRAIDITRVELGKKVVNETDWSAGKVEKDHYGWINLNDVERYANITKGAEPEISVVFEGKEGVNQKVVFIPNMAVKCGQGR
ncbi:MAG: hypothetical protein ABH829_05535 [archaeon]